MSRGHSRARNRWDADMRICVPWKGLIIQRLDAPLITSSTSYFTLVENCSPIKILTFLFFLTPEGDFLGGPLNPEQVSQVAVPGEASPGNGWTDHSKQDAGKQMLLPPVRSLDLRMRGSQRDTFLHLLNQSFYLLCFSLECLEHLSV